MLDSDEISIGIIQRLLVQGKASEAGPLINALLVKFPSNSSLYRLKIKALLISGKSEEANQYLSTIPIPDSAKEIVDLAEMFLLLEQPKKALEVLDLFVSGVPDLRSAPVFRVYSQIYETLGKHDMALNYALQAEEQSEGCMGFPTLLRLRTSATGAQEMKRDLNTLLDEYAFQEGIKPTAELATHLFRLFQGRSDMFARQILFKRGNWGYIPVHEALGPEKLLHHLMGRETLGFYLLNSDSNTRVFVIDLDVAPGALAGFLDGSLRDPIQKTIQKVTRKIMERAKNIGWPLYPEDSGHKGIHLWGFLSSFVPAKDVRVVARAILADIAIPPGIKMEIFPKQDHLSGKGFGNLVKIPLGVHGVNGRRALFLVPETLEPCNQPLAYLEQIVSLNEKEFFEVVGNLFQGALSKTSPPQMVLPALKPNGSRPSNAKTIEAVPEKIEQIVRRCSYALALLAKARNGTLMEASEVHVLAYLFHPLGEDGDAFFHQLLGQTPQYNPDWGIRKLKSVSPTVISCAKVKLRLSHIIGDRDCICKFELPWNSYASPLIHAGILPKASGKIPFGTGHPLPEIEELDGFGEAPEKETNDEEFLRIFNRLIENAPS